MPEKGVHSDIERLPLPGRIFAAVGEFILHAIEGDKHATPNQQVRSLKSAEPLHNVNVGVETLHKSNRSLDRAISLSAAGGLLQSDAEKYKSRAALREHHILKTTAFSIMKRAIIAGHESDFVPDTVTKEATFTALENGADKNKKGFMSDESASSFAAVVDRYDNVIRFPQSD